MGFFLYSCHTTLANLPMQVTGNLTLISKKIPLSLALLNTLRGEVQKKNFSFYYYLLFNIILSMNKKKVLRQVKQKAKRKRQNKKPKKNKIKKIRKKKTIF